MATSAQALRAGGALALTAVVAAALAWVGWNLGPARHLGLHRLDVVAALGYGLLAALARTVLLPFRRRPA